MKKTLENAEGITLVALVITIIILLILAGITISSLTNTGLFGRAKEAKEKTQAAEENQAKILEEYEIGTIVVGLPLNMNGTISERAEITKKFVHKLKCKYNKIKIEEIDERLTTVAAHKTMNFLDVNKHKKRNIVDTISAVYILETYLNKSKNMLKK